MHIDFGVFRVRVVRPTALLVSLGPTMTRSFVIHEGTDQMNITLGDNQFSTVRLQGLDAAGLAGKFAKPPAWAVDDPSVLMITPSADGASCRIEAASPVKLGTATLTATDQDDPTIPPITFSVEVVAEQVTKLGATIDPPAEKTPAAPADPNQPAPPPADPNAPPASA